MMQTFFVEEAIFFSPLSVKFKILYKTFIKLYFLLE